MLVEAERLLSIAAIWDDRLGPTLVQIVAQLGTIVGLIAEHAFWRFHSADQALRHRAIVHLTSGQQDGEKAPFSICECVYLRVEAMLTTQTSAVALDLLENSIGE